MTLELVDGDDIEIGKKRAYLIWLWMQTAWDLTFEQSQNNGSFQIGVIGTLGATAFYEVMTTMQLEFPMLTFAQQMAIDYDSVEHGMTCEDLYQGHLGLTFE